MDAKSHVAYLTALYLARRSNLSQEDAEDCAIAFVEAETQKAGSLDALTHLCQTDRALIWKCASDFVKNFVRREDRRRSHDDDWSQINLGDDEMTEWEVPDSEVDFNANISHEEFWNTLLLFLDRLSRQQRDYFLAHYLHGETRAAIATRTGKSIAAVEQTLYRARTKLLAWFETNQISGADLRQLLSPHPPQFARPRRNIG